MDEVREVREMEEAREVRDMEEELKLIVIREGEEEVVENPNGDDLAEEVQMQELLFFLLQPEEVLESPQGSGTTIMLSDEHIEDQQNESDTNMLSIAPIEDQQDESNTNMLSNAPIEDQQDESNTNMLSNAPIVDPKGKQLIEFNLCYSITEQGECSKAISENFYCLICMETVPTKDGFNINPCDHIFCISCMIQYITVKTEENAVSIPCPKPGCESTSLDPVTCQHILPKATFDKWSLTLCELSIGLKKFYCPFKDCSVLLIDEGGEEITSCECPHCNRMFCARCKVPWHGMSCEEFERLGQDEKGREDLMLRNLAKDKRWQRCPKCRMYVEKIDGCMFMKCRCDYCFCYVCASPMSNTTHYCEKCMR